MTDLAQLPQINMGFVYSFAHIYHAYSQHKHTYANFVLCCFAFISTLKLLNFFLEFNSVQFNFSYEAPNHNSSCLKLLKVNLIM